MMAGESHSSSSINKKHVPTEAIMIMLAPDGYYTYLQVPKPSNNESNNYATTSTTLISSETLDLIKKNYRKLSIKHHPDKPGGDVDTFRLLKRAQTVLSSPKLRQQYDILGLDLDDDDDDDHEHHHGDTDDKNAEPQTTTSQGIVHEIASMALTAILQLCVRTGECYYLPWREEATI
jgi:DnaJ domain